MAEMEDKFQEILGNPDAMSQIMSLAQSFNSSAESQPEEFGGVEEMFSGLDPKMMALAGKLMTAYQSQHRSTALMEALRPLVSEERHQMMDRLATATKIAKVLTCLWEMRKEKGDSHV